MAVKTGYSGITIRDLTDDQLRQWFWFNSDGSGTIPAGAYVLSRPVEDFKESPTGIANLYMYSGAVKLQNGLIPYAILNGDGLTLEKGGIKAGTPSQSGFIYLSTDNYTISPYVNPLPYTDEHDQAITNWRQIVGNLFGVTSEGKLYASEVNVAGAITAGEGSNVGGWVIDDTSIHSEGKATWDTDVDGIYIGQYYDLLLEETIYTISGGKARYELTEDTTVNPNKTYYIQSGAEPPYTYTPVDNPTGNPNTQGWYENTGPMWHINSDGSADFSTLSVSQDGILTVPAASISGSLTAAQIEVENLSAITAIIGSTVNSELTSNTLEIDSTNIYVLTNDDRKNPEKFYYAIGIVYIDVDNPTGSPKENKYYESGMVYQELVDPTGSPVGQGWYEPEYTAVRFEITEDITPVAGKKYYEYDNDLERYEELDTTGISDLSTLGFPVYEDTLNESTSPIDLDYYERGYIEIDDPSPTANPSSKGWYEYDSIEGIYSLSQDSSVQSSKIYYKKDYTESSDSILEEGKQYYTISYILTSDSEVEEDKVYFEYVEGFVLSEDVIVDSSKEYKYADEQYTIAEISSYSNPKRRGLYERVSESYIKLNTEKDVYTLTTDTTLQDKNYYFYNVNYFNTKDSEPNGNKIYYENTNEIDEGGNFIYRPILIVEETDNPSENGWYEREANYELVKSPESGINPASKYYYELTEEYTSEITLQKGNIAIEANDKPIFSINSEEENDVNISDVEILEKIKIGNLELVPYEDGLTIQVRAAGGEN